MGLTAGQQEVFEVLDDFGPLPDHALVPLAQHVVQSRQSSSSIRTRRNELVRKGLVREDGIIRIPRTGRYASRWAVVSGG